MGARLYPYPFGKVLSPGFVRALVSPYRNIAKGRLMTAGLIKCWVFEPYDLKAFGLRK